MRETRGVTILDISGEMPVGETTLKQEMKKMFAEGKRKFLLDMSGVTLVSDFGIGSIVEVLALNRKQGGQLKLMRLSKPVCDILQACKLNKIFEIYTAEDEAVSSFEGQERT
jgi:anti-anti-sigma factor